MSITQNDQERVKEGRSSTLKEAKLPLRDRVVKDLYRKLEEDDIGIKLSKAWQIATADIQNVLQKQETYLAQLDDFNVGKDENAFGGNSNIHIPMVFTVCKTYHARFLDAIFAVDPPFSVKPRQELNTDRVQVVEDLMRYTLQCWANEYRGVEEAVDSWVWDWCTTGTGIMKIRWNTKWESYVDVQDVEVPTTPLFLLDENNQEVTVPQFAREEREQRVTKKVFDGPQYDHVRIEDFRMIGGNGDPDLADKVFHRTFMTASELWTKADQGMFDADAVESVIEQGKDYEYATESSGLKIQRRLDSGENAFDSEAETDKYEVIECCFRYDVDGTGITTDLVAWFDEGTGTLLGCTYLRRIMPSGQRPYAVAHFHKRPGETYGLGLTEILHPLAVELDAMHNIRIDNALFQSIPFFFYRASSSFNPEKIGLEPGVGVPVDNPATDVFFPSLPNRVPFGAQEEATVQSYVERLTGISDLSLGVMTGVQGATRTAAGVRAMMGENNANLSVHFRRLNRGWTKVLKTTYHLLQNRCPPGFAFRVTGDDGQDVFRQVFDSDLAMEVDFELSSNTANSNKSVQIEVAQQLMSLTMNPINIQVGLCGPNEIYAAQKHYLNTLGVKDVHRFIKKPQDYFYALTPEEEFKRVIQGQRVPVAPQADHNGFVAYAQTILDANTDVPVQQKTLNPEQEEMLISQMRAHQAMQEALDQQAAQMANIQQMQANMAMSPNGMGEALNPQAGANPGMLMTQGI